jgi:spermidine synthase
MLSGFIRRLAALFAADHRPPDTADASERPYVRRGFRYTSLQFNRRDAQSRMLTAQPDRLLVDYTCTMMGALLLQPAPRIIGMIGLGGGSQAKFCHRHLPHSRIEVAEISAEVIALRAAFHLPPDDARLAVQRADGADFVAERRGHFDVLLVDGYDAAGIARSLSSQAFYDDCRRALGEHGVMAVNLYGSTAADHLQWIRHAFGSDMLVLVEPRMSNTVVLAWRGQAAERVKFGPGGMAVCPARLDGAAWEALRPVFERVAVALRRRGPTAEARRSADSMR